jgi:hypothetical protein
MLSMRTATLYKRRAQGRGAVELHAAATLTPRPYGLRFQRTKPTGAAAQDLKKPEEA